MNGWLSDDGFHDCFPSSCIVCVSPSEWLCGHDKTVPLPNANHDNHDIHTIEGIQQQTRRRLVVWETNFFKCEQNAKLGRTVLFLRPHRLLSTSIHHQVELMFGNITQSISSSHGRMVHGWLFLLNLRQQSTLKDQSRKREEIEKLQLSGFPLFSGLLLLRMFKDYHGAGEVEGNK